MGRHFTTDCEGPISKNDNAQELSAHFVPNGEAFFRIISKYDDFLADVVKRPGYNAGDTLKLILPFLLAYGANNESVRRYSRSHILLIKGAREALRLIRRNMDAFIISTSYEPYIRALCDVVNFPADCVYCTELDLDRYVLDSKEEVWLKENAAVIGELEMPQWDGDARRITDLGQNHQRTIDRLDRVFWQAIPEMKIGRILEDVKPVGGPEKANAVLRSLEGTGRELADVMYVGDSITDVQALELVRENGGLAVSFNGNRYAIQSAEVCCVSEDARIIAVLAHVFHGEGRDGVLDLAHSWASRGALGSQIDDDLQGWLDALPAASYPRLDLISHSNRRDLTSASEAFRKSVRGELIGALG
jgi:energy-converting hydrogenase A subunit R